MVKQLYYIFLIVLFSSYSSYCQEYNEVKTKNNIIGFNVTEMVSQFIPFKERVELTGPFQFMWKVGNNGKMFNLQLGFLPDDFSRIGYANVAIGYSRQKSFSEKFYYISSQSLIISQGSLNTRERVQAPEFFFDKQNSIGVDLAWGIGYRLGKRVSIYSETSFLVLRSEFTDFIEFEFVPPIGLYLVAELNR